jgi:hypothetical protein
MIIIAVTGDEDSSSSFWDLSLKVIGGLMKYSA